MIEYLIDLDVVVDWLLQWVDGFFCVGVLLVLGKLYCLFNVLYVCVENDVLWLLQLYIVLLLNLLCGGVGLEVCFMGLFVECYFGVGFLCLVYVDVMVCDCLFDYVQVEEFYMQLGVMLGLLQVQCSYISFNYIYVVDVVVQCVLYVIVQKVVMCVNDWCLLLLCNNDIIQDILDVMVVCGLLCLLMIVEIDL